MIFRRRKLTDKIPELKPYYEEFRQSAGHRWLRMLLWGLFVAAVVILLVLGGRWTYNKIKDDQPSVKPTPSPAANKAPARSSTEDGVPKSVSPPDKPPPAPPSPSALPNNGPGEVAVLFTLTSLAAASLHYLLSLRRAAR